MFKRIFYGVIVFLLLAGCSSKEAYRGYRDTFSDNAAKYYAAADKPLLDLKLPAPDGKEYHLVVNREVKPLQVQQIKDSEWATPVSKMIGGLTTIGSIWMAGKIFDDVAGGGSQTIDTGGGDINGFNSAGHGLSWQDYHPVSTITGE